MSGTWISKPIVLHVDVKVDDGEPMDDDAQFSLNIYMMFGDTIERLEEMRTSSETENWPVDNLTLAATALLDIAAAARSWKAGRHDQAYIETQMAGLKNAEWRDFYPVVATKLEPLKEDLSDDHPQVPQ